MFHTQHTVGTFTGSNGHLEWLQQLDDKKVIAATRLIREAA